MPKIWTRDRFFTILCFKLQCSAIHQDLCVESAGEAWEGPNCHNLSGWPAWSLSTNSWIRCRWLKQDPHLLGKWICRYVWNGTDMFYLYYKVLPRQKCGVSAQGRKYRPRSETLGKLIDCGMLCERKETDVTEGWDGSVRCKSPCVLRVV